MHYLCNLLSCGHQIWILGVPDMDATNSWNLTYFRGQRDQNGQIKFWEL